MSREKKRGLLSEDGIWSLWVRSVYAAPEVTSLSDLPIQERYRQFADWHRDLLRNELKEQWGHTESGIDRFLRAGPRRGSVLAGESSLMNLRRVVEIESVHAIANEKLDSILLDGLLLLESAYRAIEGENYREAQQVLPLVFKYLDASRSGLRDAESRRKKVQAGRKGAEKKWGAHREVLKLVQSLSCLTNELGEYSPPKELWPLLFSELERAGLNPKEYGNRDSLYDATDPSFYEYTGGRIRYNAFREAVRSARKKM